jgi:hypothetical protein
MPSDNTTPLTAYTCTLRGFLGTKDDFKVAISREMQRPKKRRRGTGLVADYERLRERLEDLRRPAMVAGVKAGWSSESMKHLINGSRSVCYDHTVRVQKLLDSAASDKKPAAEEWDIAYCLLVGRAVLLVQELDDLCTLAGGQNLYASDGDMMPANRLARIFDVRLPEISKMKGRVRCRKPAPEERVGREQLWLSLHDVALEVEKKRQRKDLRFSLLAKDSDSHKKTGQSQDL